MKVKAKILKRAFKILKESEDEKTCVKAGICPKCGANLRRIQTETIPVFTADIIICSKCNYKVN